MKNLTCPEFLQHRLPRLRFRWAGFRRVHKQVCNRLGRRIMDLGLSGFSAYEHYLSDHPEEWQILDSMLVITISRFYRDRGVFDMLSSEILPSIAKHIVQRGGKRMNCWSAGCCSGEEAYTLQILWKLRVLPSVRLNLPLRIIATDSNRDVIQRAREGYYSGSSLRELPEELIREAFARSENSYKIRDPFAENIEFIEQDIRMQEPEGFFHAIFCRNLVLTYFEEALQREILQRISERLCEGGIFVVGIHESLPEGVIGMRPYDKTPGVYRKAEWFLLDKLWSVLWDSFNNMKKRVIPSVVQWRRTGYCTGRTVNAFIIIQPLRKALLEVSYIMDNIIFAFYAFTSVFIVVNPFGGLLTFISLTEGMNELERKQIAKRSVIIAGILALVFALAGEIILRIFNITVDNLRVAGGVLLFVIALDMLHGRMSRESVTPEEMKDASRRENISVFPIATPLLTGPGAITTVIVVIRSGGAVVLKLIAIAAIVLTFLVTYLIFRYSTRLYRMLGVTVSLVITRIMGLLLAAIAVNFIAVGIWNIYMSFR